MGGALHGSGACCSCLCAEEPLHEAPRTVFFNPNCSLVHVHCQGWTAFDSIVVPTVMTPA